MEDSALETVKCAAQKAKVSANHWFAKFAVGEQQKQARTGDTFFAELDRQPHQPDTTLDFLLPDDRYQRLGISAPRTLL